MPRFAKYAYAVLIYNMGVILWGAYVRATGSGAGCGSHWPTCNGEVLPRAPQIETIIEFTHRLTSGLSLLLVLGLLVWALRSYARGHRVRTGAWLSSAFIISEALVGAGLVLFEWVAHDQSLGRVISMGVHLVNTFLLLAALSATAWWAGGGEPINLRGHGAGVWLFGVAFGLLILLGVSGAVTALGDTLFPSASLGEGVRQDFLPTAHFLVRLRVWHPVVAVLVGLYITGFAGVIANFRVNPAIRRWCAVLLGLFLAQLAAGLVNLLLLAPVAMQIVHLFLAELVWVALVFLALGNFAISEVSQRPSPQHEVSPFAPPSV
jgi:heme A synthase